MAKEPLQLRIGSLVFFLACHLFAPLNVTVNVPVVFADEQGEKTIALLESSANSIKTFEVHLVMKNILFTEDTPVFRDGRIIGFDKRVALKEPSVREVHSRQLFKSGRHRIEVFEGPEGPLRQVTSGGLESDLLWRPKAFTAFINLPSSQVIDPGADYREMYRDLVGTISIVQIMRERKNLLIRREEDKGRFLVVETDPMPKENIHYSKWGFRIRADASLNMLPVILETYEIIDGERFVTRRLTVTEHKQIAEGVYAPVRAVAELFDQNKTMGFFGNLMGKQEITVDPRRSRWNIPIKDEAFHIPLPAGVKVVDTIKEVVYVTGKPDPGKNLDELAAKARGVTTIIPARPQPKNWMPWIVAGSIATVFVAALSYFFFRRKRLLRAVS